MKKTMVVMGMVLAVQWVGASALAEETESAKEMLKKVESVEDALDARAAGVAESLDMAAAKVAAAADGVGADLSRPDPTLAAYFKHKEEMVRAQNPRFDSEVLVPIFVPTTMFGMTALIVFLALRYRKEKRAEASRIQMKAMDLGLQFIPEVPAMASKLPPVRNDRRTGLILAALGVSYGVPIALYGYPREGVFGLALIFLGGAYFLAGKYLAADKE